MRDWPRTFVSGARARPIAFWLKWVMAGVGASLLIVLALSAARLYRDRYTAEAARPSATQTSPSAPSPYWPLVSRGKPVSCSSDAFTDIEGGSNAITSGKYGDWSFWQAGLTHLPSWCAVHIGSGPSRLLVAWTSNYVFDYIATDGMTPRDYTLAVSSDSTNGSDGHWRVVVSVTNNETRVREAVIPFAGMSWVKMTVTKGQAHPSQNFVRIDQIDCYDVSAGLSGTTLFEGDSITSLTYVRADSARPSFDELIHQAAPKLFPTMLAEGMGGWTSSGAVDHINLWLSLNPDIHYWLLGWGTNDAMLRVTPQAFHDNMQYLIDQIKAAGHVPVLARIPALNRSASLEAADDAEVRALNAQIDQLTQANHLIPGPDLYSLVKAHISEYLGPDGIHPTGMGKLAFNQAWYAAMRDTLVASAT